MSSEPETAVNAEGASGSEAPSLLPRKKIAILGTTPTRMMAPLDDPEWEIWTIGPGGMDAHRWDVLWEVHHHKNGSWPEDFGEYLKKLSHVKKPQAVASLLPMRDLIERWFNERGTTPEKRAELEALVDGPWEANIVFDVERMQDRFCRRMWFSSSISYCLAAAIDTKPTDIGLFGIDLESGEEYISQHTGAAHFIDLAREHGINVHMPPGCGLERDLNPYPDRYETHLAQTFEKKFHWLEGTIGQLRAQIDEMGANKHRQEGAILAMRSMQAPSTDIDTAEQNLGNINVNLGRMQANLHHLEGERSCIQYFRRMYVWGVVDPES